MSSREESTQFSLTELLKLEDERIAEVRRSDEDRTKAAEQARRDAADRAATDAEARARAAQQTELDDLARREAMQKAIVEQARLDVEARTRTEERELERQHELALAALRTEGSKSQLGTILGGTGLGAATMLAAALAIHFAVLRPTAERRVQELEVAAAAAESRATEALLRIEEDRKLIAQLRTRAADDAPAAAPVHPTTPPPVRGAPVRSPTRTVVPVAPDPCAGSKDPLCGLQR